MIALWALPGTAVLVEVKTHNHVVALLLLILAVLCVIALRIDAAAKELERIGKDRP